MDLSRILNWDGQNEDVELPSHPNGQRPMHEVFATAELLECILVNLDTRDLLRAIGACHHWRNVALSSPQCRRTLFLEPQRLREAVIWHYHSQPYKDDFYHALFQLTLGLSNPLGADRPLPEDAIVAKLHPFLPFGWAPPLSSMLSDTTSMLSDTRAGISVRCNGAKLVAAAYLWPHAFITQPPCPMAYIRLKIPLPSYQAHWRLGDPVFPGGDEPATFSRIHEVLRSKGLLGAFCNTSWEVEIWIRNFTTDSDPAVKEARRAYPARVELKNAMHITDLFDCVLPEEYPEIAATGRPPLEISGSDNASPRQQHAASAA